MKWITERKVAKNEDYKTRKERNEGKGKRMKAEKETIIEGKKEV